MSIIFLPFVYIIICIAGNAVLPPVDYKAIAEAKSKADFEKSKINTAPELQIQNMNHKEEFQTNSGD